MMRFPVKYKHTSYYVLGLFIASYVLLLYLVCKRTFDKGTFDVQTNNHDPYTTLLNLTCPLSEIFPNEFHIDRNNQFFELRKEIVTVLPSKYTISGSSICKQNEQIELLILIPSVIKETIFRKNIRGTWASEIYHPLSANALQVKLVFIFGDFNISENERDILNNEAMQFNDIATINMLDSYQNLSLKIASSLNWSAKMCSSAKFVAKVDMDTLLNIPLLLLLLQQVSYRNPQVFGFKHVARKPIVVRKGRWAVPMKVYPFFFFPCYSYGHSYVLTRRAVENIVSAFPYFPIIPNEDAFITGIMPLVTNVTRMHSAAFTNLFYKQSCQDIRNGRFVSFLHNKSKLRSIWHNLQNGNCSDGPM